MLIREGPDGARAAFSPCGRYRYTLTRRWGAAPPVLFCLLNPSTADETRLDPTLTRCAGFARREGAGGMEVVNIFAFRATRPEALREAPDPVGPETDAVLRAAAGHHGAAICGWGHHGALLGRGAAAAALLRAAGARLFCLGRTATGAPRHPLYLPAAADLTDWP